LARVNCALSMIGVQKGCRETMAKPRTGSTEVASR
jgi:hypothetical protein